MVYQQTAQGTRKVNHLFKADFFGERALLTDEPRAASVEAITKLRSGAQCDAMGVTERRGNPPPHSVLIRRATLHSEHCTRLVAPVWWVWRGAYEGFGLIQAGVWYWPGIALWPTLGRCTP